MAIPRKSSQSEQIPESKPESNKPAPMSPPDVAGVPKVAVAVAVAVDAKPAADVAPAIPSTVIPAETKVVTTVVTETAPTELPPRPVPHPAVAVSSSQSAAPVSDDDLPSILRRLNPVQRAKLRSAAISEGLIQQSNASRENTDGSLSVMIRVDGDLVPQLRTWAEEAGKPVDEQIREIVGMLLSSYLMSPWEASQPVAAGASVTTAAPPAAK